MPSSFADNPQALTWAAAFLLGVSLGRWIGQWRDRRRRLLKGEVANSGRLIAAWRAVESLELDGKLFTDELAATLAGNDVFNRALASAEPIAEPSAHAGAPGRRLYKISQVAARTYWFDRQIMTALTSPAVPASRGWLSGRLRGSFSARGPSAPPRQVVVLGSGMDSRPWRLPLPPNCQWFEIDTEDVLEAKQRALRQAGAELPSRGVGAGVIHPLRCERWVAVAANLNGNEWIDTLKNEGFDSEKPTVWVLEGLIMYLSPDHVRSLLTMTADAAAPGSTLLLHSLTDEALEDIRNGSASEAGFYSPQLVQTWQSSVPQDPSALLEEAGWLQQSMTSRAGIASQICGGVADGKCAFETRSGQGVDRTVCFHGW